VFSVFYKNKLIKIILQNKHKYLFSNALRMKFLSYCRNCGNTFAIATPPATSVVATIAFVAVAADAIA